MNPEEALIKENPDKFIKEKQRECEIIERMAGIENFEYRMKTPEGIIVITKDSVKAIPHDD